MNRGDCITITRHATVREYGNGHARHALKPSTRGVIIGQDTIGALIVAVDGIKPPLLIPSQIMTRAHDPKPQPEHLAD